MWNALEMKEKGENCSLRSLDRFCMYFVYFRAPKRTFFSWRRSMYQILQKWKKQNKTKQMFYRHFMCAKCSLLCLWLLILSKKFHTSYTMKNKQTNRQTDRVRERDGEFMRMITVVKQIFISLSYHFSLISIDYLSCSVFSSFSLFIFLGRSCVYA